MWLYNAESVELEVFLFQRGLRHGEPAERGHQEAVAALPERDARQAGLQRIQADEISQSQKCEPHVFSS
jgi:hypothetical protein